MQRGGKWGFESRHKSPQQGAARGGGEGGGKPQQVVAWVVTCGGGMRGARLLSRGLRWLAPEGSKGGGKWGFES